MKPNDVKIGQAWTYKGLQGRPLFVIAIEDRPGCSTNHPPEEIVKWAIFRKGKCQPIHDMIESSNWKLVDGENK